LVPDRGERGPAVANKRRTVNGILWVLRTGAPWRDMPKRFGNWTSVFVRFTRWGINTLTTNEPSHVLDWASHQLMSATVRFVDYEHCRAEIAKTKVPGNGLRKVRNGSIATDPFGANIVPRQESGSGRDSVARRNPQISNPKIIPFCARYFAPRLRAMFAGVPVNLGEIAQSCKQ
jgi:transposase